MGFSIWIYVFGFSRCNGLIITERRIIYDFEKFGDSPACIGKEKNLENQVALTQGFGITENTTDLAYFKPKLLETNVTLISNDDCYNKIRKVVFSYYI